VAHRNLYAPCDVPMASARASTPVCLTNSSASTGSVKMYGAGNRVVFDAAKRADFTFDGNAGSVRDFHGCLCYCYVLLEGGGPGCLPFSSFLAVVKRGRRSSRT